MEILRQESQGKNFYRAANAVLTADILAKDYESITYF